MGTSADRLRVVNVTSDSAPGWLPSPELEQRARKTALDFMGAEDGARYEDAYAFLADIDRKNQTLSDFSGSVRQFNLTAGPVLSRQITTLTWTKDPAHAPLPGVYAAFDVVSRFANVDRHCGYLVLWQSSPEQPFRVMREESNFLDNATAASIAKKSPSAVGQAWATLSAHCPNYRPDARLEPLPETPGASIGYPNVEAALTALHSKAGVVFTTRNGWTIAEDAATRTIWSFPPVGNAAYPAAVKRQIVEEGGSVSIDMAVHCEAKKQACDDLVRSFEQMNARMSDGMRGRQ